MKKFGSFIFIVLSVFLLVSCIFDAGSQLVEINFDANGGEIYLDAKTSKKQLSLTVAQGTSLPLIIPKIGDGTTVSFLGWYSSDDVKYTPGTVVKSKLNLTAKWEGDVAGGTSEKTTVVADEPTTVTVKSSPVKSSTTIELPAGAVTSENPGDTIDVQLSVTSYPVEITSAKASTTEGAQFYVTGKNTAVAAIDCKLEVSINGGDPEPVTEFNGEKVTVKTNILCGLNPGGEKANNPKVKYSGNPDENFDDVTYDNVTGLLTFTTTHFSTFYVEIDAEAYIVETNTAYKTLKDALGKVDNNQTVRLIKNITYSGADNVKLVLNRDKSFTIDGNDHSITATYTDDTDKASTLIDLTPATDPEKTERDPARKPSVVNIKNWNITATGYRYAVVYDSDDDGYYTVNGTLTNCKIVSNYVGLGVSGNDYGDSEVNLYNCDISHNGENDDYSEENKTKYLYCAIAPQFDGKINVYSGNYESTLFAAYIYSTGGTLNIYGGTFKATKEPTKPEESTVGTVLIAQVSNSFSTVHEKAEINISGGSFDGEIKTLSDKGQGASISISSGEFKNTTFTTSAKSDNANSYTEITGGVFSTDPSTYVADGYEAIANMPSKGKWTVKKAAEEVSITNNSEPTSTYITSLNTFRNSVNAGNSYAGYTVTLLKNVDLSDVEWTPIGTSSNPFSGIFDGSEKSVNIKITKGDHVGFFGYIKNSTIKNLTVNGSVESSDNIAGVCSYTDGTCYFEKVVNNASVKVSDQGNGKAGGILESLRGTVYLKDCKNTGTIKASGSVRSAGGIVSYCLKDSSVNAGGCENTGSVSSSKYAGGIVGYCLDIKEAKIEDCKNSGNITTNLSDAGCISSGIITRAYNSFNIKGCSNSGSISGNNGVAGGIVGIADTLNSNCNIESCSNSGSVSVTNDGFTGGVLGNLSTQTDYTLTIKNCSGGTASISGKYSGRIIGQISSSTSLNNNGIPGGLVLYVNNNNGDSYNGIKTVGSTCIGRTVDAGLTIVEGTLHGWPVFNSVTNQRITFKSGSSIVANQTETPFNVDSVFFAHDEQKGWVLKTE